MGEILMMIGALGVGVGVMLFINRTKKEKAIKKGGKYEEDISG